MFNATEFDILAAARDRLQAAARGQRAQITREAASALGCSVPTLYRKLAQAGFDAQRKRRSDAGECLLDDEALQMVAGTLAASANAKGQRLPIADALDMLHASGALCVDVSPSTVGRQLYARRMHPEQLRHPEPAVQLASEHPNHAWQIDSTTGAYYYLPGGRLRWMPEDQFYKNKVANIVKASSDLLTRYAAVDHCSGAGKVRYYLGGETAANLLDFAVWAMSKQPESPMHGVPLVLMMDPGAANKGQLMRNYAQRCGIALKHHAAGAARVTGAVEKFHDLARMHFEMRLRFVNPAEVTLAWLNDTAAKWAAAYCATRIHGRHGCTRFAKWMEIAGAQLRFADEKVLRDAATSEPEQRRVSNTKTVEFRGRTYDLGLVPGVAVGLKVTLVMNVFRDPAIDVLFTDSDTRAETWHVVEPMQVDQHGFRIGAPVIGQDMRSAAFSDIDHRRGEFKREAYRTGDGLPTLAEAAAARKAHAPAYAGKGDAFADVNATEGPT